LWIVKGKIQIYSGKIAGIYTENSGKLLKNSGGPPADNILCSFCLAILKKGVLDDFLRLIRWRRIPRQIFIPSLTLRTSMGALQKLWNGGGDWV
jgi:hypothetical protein